MLSTDTQSRFASVVIGKVLRPPSLSAIYLALSLFLCSSVNNARGESRVLVSAQALQGSEMETRDLLGGMEEISVSPTRGYLFALKANQFFFTRRK